jgi:hypothetical protein
MFDMPENKRFPRIPLKKIYFFDKTLFVGIMGELN